MSPSLFTSLRPIVEGGDMAILLKDFIVKALNEGANLAGCFVQCGKHQYRFTGLDSSGRVEILYGANFETPSRLNDWINVYGCRQTNSSGGVRTAGKKKVLVLDCNNPHRD